MGHSVLDTKYKKCRKKFTAMVFWKTGFERQYNAAPKIWIFWCGGDHPFPCENKLQTVNK
jgi:hypothetical protein